MEQPSALPGVGETARETWSSNLEFLLSCLGYAVGLGNVWRFPVQAYENGGGVFFIPYWIMLFFLGMPVFLLELTIGQYSGAGPTTCWNFCPLAQGIGFGMTMVSALTAMYYNMIIAWAVYFLGMSMTSELPWEKCDPEFTSERCIDRVRRVTKAECLLVGTPCENGTCRAANATGDCDGVNGVCQPYGDESQLIIWDTKLAFKSGCKISFAAKEYFTNVVLELDKKGTLADLGDVELHLLFCYFLAWCIACLCLMGGVRATGKVVYVTAIAPYLVLCVMFFRGIVLDGALLGLEFYLKPDFSKLLDADVWQAAATQISFSLSTAYGGLITLASYNKFNNDIHRDTLIVSIGNCLTSVFAGFVVFSYVGHLAENQGLGIYQLSNGGTDLVFGVYPFVLTLLPGSVMWSIVFFFMIIMLGIDSQFVIIETVVTSLADTFPQYLRQRKPHTVVAVSIILFIAGIPLTTSGGLYLLDFIDTYAGGWNVLFLGLFECMAILYYGTDRLIDDIELMTGNKFKSFQRNWWIWTWTLTTPVLSSLVIFASLLKVFRTMGEKDVFFDLVIGLLLITFNTSFMVPVGVAAYHVYKADGQGFMEKLKNASAPTPEWAPRDSGEPGEITGMVVEPSAEPKEEPKEEEAPRKPSRKQTAEASDPVNAEETANA